MNYYYADKSNTAVGPYTLDDLHALHLNGVIGLDTNVCPEGGTAWQPYQNVRIVGAAAAPGALPATPPPNSSNPQPVGTGTAILWFLCCLPIGFTMWGQAAKGWVWVIISICTGGFGGLVAIVDYWMCYAAQTRRKVGDWEFFPR